MPFSALQGRLPTRQPLKPAHAAWVRLHDFLERTGLFVPAIFLVLMWWRAPYLDPQDWDYDEGINLMKSLLMQHGYALYTQVWSDQPPLLTALLAGWAALFGPSVAAARVLILLFAALLLWSLYQAMRATVSARSATIALLLLVASEYFLRLSSAVMVGLPALTVATTVLALLMTGRPTWWRIASAGALFGMALQIKLIVLLIGPAAGIALLVGPAAVGTSWARRLSYVALFGVATAAFFVAIALPFNALQPALLLGTHFGEQTWRQAVFVVERSQFMPDFLKQHVVYLLVALFGTLWAVRRMPRRLWTPLTWFVTTIVALSIHRPLWYHHVLLLTVPLSWLCAFGVEWWVHTLDGLDSRPRWNTVKRRAVLVIVSAVGFVLAFLMVPSSLDDRQELQMSLNRPNYIPYVFERFAQDAKQTPGWVFTDHPFYAYQVGLPVPPPIAVMSRKRFETGAISQDELLRVLQEYTPRYILLERFTASYGEPIMALINERYEQVVEIEPARYYRLKAGFDAGRP